MSVQVRPAALTAAAEQFVGAGRELRAQATALEGSGESVPKVGDVQAALTFGKAHYDWAQTRFEDLIASADELAQVSNLLTRAAEAFTGQDRRTGQVLTSIVSALGDHPGSDQS